MKNEKVLSKSGRSLVKHGYWKTKASEGAWDNGKQIGKHIHYYMYDPNVITDIILYTSNGDGQRILGIEYKNHCMIFYPFLEKKYNFLLNFKLIHLYIFCNLLVLIFEQIYFVLFVVQC
jgi:hypothetical protein